MKKIFQQMKNEDQIIAELGEVIRSLETLKLEDLTAYFEFLRHIYTNIGSSTLNEAFDVFIARIKKHKEYQEKKEKVTECRDNWKELCLHVESLHLRKLYEKHKKNEKSSKAEKRRCCGGYIDRFISVNVDTDDVLYDLTNGGEVNERTIKNMLARENTKHGIKKPSFCAKDLPIYTGISDIPTNSEAWTDAKIAAHLGPSSLIYVVARMINGLIYPETSERILFSTLWFTSTVFLYRTMHTEKNKDTPLFNNQVGSLQKLITDINQHEGDIEDFIERIKIAEKP